MRGISSPHAQIMWPSVLAGHVTRFPVVFLTNGGGVTEDAKAEELSQWLGVRVRGNQVRPAALLGREERRVLCTGALIIITGSRVVPHPNAQVVLSHTPFRSLAASLGSKPVLVAGVGAVPEVAATYGFKHVVTTADLARAAHLRNAVPFWAGRSGKAIHRCLLNFTSYIWHASRPHWRICRAASSTWGVRCEEPGYRDKEAAH